MINVVKLLDAAVAVLEESSGALDIKEIVKRATDAGVLDSVSSTPEASMGAAIYMDIKKRRQKSVFVKTGSSTFDLRVRDPPPPVDLNAGAANKEKHKPNTRGGHGSADTRTVGVAGERRVESELLLRGYETTKPAVDVGIDLKCSKSGNNFNIQVKTTNPYNKTDKHIFTIKEKAFSKHDGPETWYVFALLDDYEFDFVTVSSKEIRRMVEQGHMTKNKAGYQASFAKTKDGIFLGKNRKDMSSYTNDWDF